MAGGCATWFSVAYCSTHAIFGPLPFEGTVFTSSRGGADIVPTKEHMQTKQNKQAQIQSQITQKTNEMGKNGTLTKPHHNSKIQDQHSSMFNFISLPKWPLCTMYAMLCDINTFDSK